MNDELNPSTWTATEFRLDARNGVREIRKLLEQNAADIQKTTVETFRNPSKAWASIEDELLNGRQGVAKLSDKLQNDHKSIGNLNKGRDHELGTLQKQLARRDDLLRSYSEHDALSTRALLVGELRGREREAETAKLISERRYCRSVFETRETMHGARGPGDGSVGAMKVPDRILIEQARRDLKAAEGRKVDIPAQGKNPLQVILDKMSAARAKPAAKQPVAQKQPSPHRSKDRDLKRQREPRSLADDRHDRER